jgi:hypothetical protein
VSLASVAPNYISVDVYSATGRTGTLTIAGQTVSVTQNGVGCTYDVSPTSVSMGQIGGASSVGVTTNGTGCDWGANTQTPWIHMTETTSGIASGTVTFSVDLNSGAQRTGTLTVAVLAVVVTQAGCSYAVSPTSFHFTENGTNPNPAKVQVTAGTGCARAASTQTSWIHVPAVQVAGAVLLPSQWTVIRVVPAGDL